MGEPVYLRHSRGRHARALFAHLAARRAACLKLLTDCGSEVAEQSLRDIGSMHYWPVETVLAPLHSSCRQGDSPMTVKTVVELDLVGYSDISRNLEENLGAKVVADFNKHIQGFVDAGLKAIKARRKDVVKATTGDGAILAFADPANAHVFGVAVHKAAQTHNATVSSAAARRLFRIGIATGDFHEDRGSVAGTVISRAVRMEAASEPGQMLIDISTFDGLPLEYKALYGQEEIVAGKRGETFPARRLNVVQHRSPDDGKPSEASILRDARPRQPPPAAAAGEHHPLRLEAHGNENYIHMPADKYEQNSAYTVATRFHLFTGDSPAILLSFSGHHHARGCVCLNDAPQLRINNAAVKISSDNATLASPYALPAQSAAFVGYTRRVWPPLTVMSAADCDYGDIEVCVRYRIGASTEKLVKWFELQPGGEMKPIAGGRDVPYLSDQHMAQLRNEGRLSSEDYDRLVGYSGDTRYRVAFSDNLSPNYLEVPDWQRELLRKLVGQPSLDDLRRRSGFQPL